MLASVSSIGKALRADRGHLRCSLLTALSSGGLLTVKIEMLGGGGQLSPRVAQPSMLTPPLQGLNTLPADTSARANGWRLVQVLTNTKALSLGLLDCDGLGEQG